MKNRPQIRGFTLTELIITISIVAILLAIGAPSYTYVTNVNRIATEVNGLLGDMQYARAEAIKEGIPVSICVSSNGSSCAGAGTTAWQNGWIVFFDGDGSGTVNGNDQVLRIQNTFAGADTFTADNTTNVVTFNREGFASLPGTVTFTLHTATANSSWTRCLAATIVGSMTTQTSGTGNCT